MNSSICGCGSKGNSFLNDPPLIKDSNFNLVFQPIEFEIVLVDIAIVKKSPDQIDSAILLLRWQCGSRNILLQNKYYEVYEKFTKFVQIL